MNSIEKQNEVNLQAVKSRADPYFRIEVLSQTWNPQKVIYAALHQDYSEEYIWDELGSDVNSADVDDFDQIMQSVSRGPCTPVHIWNGPSEEKCGEIAVERLLKGGRGHWGPLEHPQIVFNCGWFPHSTMQQLRTHRHASFDVQSGRYSGKRIADVVLGAREVEEVFYLRPVGDYKDRSGKKYTYTKEHRYYDKLWCIDACNRYKEKIDEGFSEEHARGTIPFDVRQHWVVSCNMRSLVHLLSIRGKTDAQLECQQWADLVLPHFKNWAPQIFSYFEQHQWKKGRLAP